MADMTLAEEWADRSPESRRGILMSMQAVTPDGAIRRYGLNGEEYYQIAVNGVYPEWMVDDEDLMAAVKHSESLTPEQWREALAAENDRIRDAIAARRKLQRR